MILITIHETVHRVLDKTATAQDLPRAAHMVALGCNTITTSTRAMTPTSHHKSMVRRTAGMPAKESTTSECLLGVEARDSAVSRTQVRMVPTISTPGPHPAPTPPPTDSSTPIAAAATQDTAAQSTMLTTADPTLVTAGCSCAGLALGWL